MAFASTLSGLSLVATDTALYLYVLNGENQQTMTGTLDTKEKGSWGRVEQMLERLGHDGSIYLSADTYMFLVLKHKLLTEQQVAGVFPWPARDKAEFIPTNDPATDLIARRSSFYYYYLNFHTMKDWMGKATTFPHRAANTMSYRAYAPYQMIKVEDRGRIAPVDSTRSILQFDWSAAEWSLILQHTGYELPEGDAYGALSQAAERDTVKNIVLPYIYGSSQSSLCQRHDAQVVQAVIRQMEITYPRTLEWATRIKTETGATTFQGFRFELGEGADSYKRPNHWAQTALQLCKWDLLSRLAAVGAHTIACGDLHDQLFFDVGKDDASLAQSAIAEIRAPCFGRYKLTPKFKVGPSWQ